MQHFPNGLYTQKGYEYLFMSEFQRVLKSECQRLEREIRRRNSLLNILADGYLSVRSQNGANYLYWDHDVKKDGESYRKQDLLHEADRKKVKQLRQRRLYTKQLPLMTKNLKWLKKLLKHYTPCDDHTIVATLPLGYQDSFDYHGFLPETITTEISPDAFHPEHLIYRNSRGELFRSKGEVQISELLITRKIPFQYEAPLNLNGKWISPDFTFNLPGTDRTVFLEFFGMMDNPDYFHRNTHKIQSFLNSEYVVGRDVLFLFESKTSGSDLSTIIRQLDSFLNQ